jgi:hypothetical protein
MAVPTIVSQPPVAVTNPPTQQAVTPVPEEFLVYAGQMIDQIKTEHYKNATALQQLAPLIPSNLQEDLAIYLNILGQINNNMNLTATYLNQTTASLRFGNLTQAGTQLGLVRGQLTQAQSNLQILDLTLTRIKDIFGISVEAQRSELTSLAALIGSYQQRANQLEKMLTEADKRTATILDLKASAEEILVNQTVTVAGRLKDVHGNALVNRTIAIYLQGLAFNENETSSDGSFTFTLRITPQMNLTTAIFYALFQPQGTDTNMFRPSASANVTVALRYLPAQLTFSLASASVHVNQTLRGTGTLLGQGGSLLANRTIQLSIDGGLVATTLTDTNGRFTFLYMIPPGTPELTHNVTVTFNPTYDLYSTQSNSTTLSVYYYHTSVSAAFSAGWIFSGQPLQATGTVQGYSTPIANGTLLAFLDGVQASNASVNQDGGFRMSISIPMEKSNSTAITILYTSSLPWIKGSSTSYMLAVTNSLSVIVAGSALAVVGLAVYTSPRTILQTIKKPFKKEEETEDQKVPRGAEEEEAAPPVTEAAIDIAKLREGRTENQALKAVYWAVREFLAIRLAIPSHSSLTHLEFLNAAVSASKKDQPNLAKLTRGFELAEYAERQISKSDWDQFVNDSVVVVEANGGKVIL